MGVAYFKTNSLDKAIQAFKQSILTTKIDRIIDNCYLNLTYIYLKRNDTSNTKRNYEILLRRNRELAEKFSSEMKGDRELWMKFEESTRQNEGIL